MRWPNPLQLCCVLIWACSFNCIGVTIEQLENDTRLTPERFARNFVGFDFRFRPEVQSPESFLATRSGDCDDYATLAVRVLKRRGYKPQLIAVRMKKLVHVVCFVPEVGAFLDYNERNASAPLIASDGSLADIAEKVATTFNKSWTSASEFTF